MTAATTTKTRKRRVLIVVNDTVDGPTLCDAIGGHAAGARARVHLVAPAFNSRVRHWLSDEDGARRSAETRLHSCLAELDAMGIEATGAIGDPEPLQAIEDSLCAFAADRVILAFTPAKPARGLTSDLAERATGRFGVPVILAAA
jgi:hypothetical protein